MNAGNGHLAGRPGSELPRQPSQEAATNPFPAPVIPPDAWAFWDGFLERTEETGFMQSSWWTDFHGWCGFENFGVTLKDGSDIVGGAIVQKLANANPSFYYIQDGPVLPAEPMAAEEVFNAILGEIEQHRGADPAQISHLRIEPRWVTLPGFVHGFRPIRPLSDPYLETRDTRCIDLRPAESEILAQMKPKGRYNIGVAQRHGVSVVEDTSAKGIADFLRIYKRMAIRQKLRVIKPPDYFQMLITTLAARQRGSLFFAEYKGKRLATAVVVYFGNRATYFYGGSLAIHRQTMAPYLLHFEVMRKAKALGLEWYDLWGVAPRNEPDHPWQNISIFKAKFGGLEVNLVPTLDLVYDAAAYEQFMATNAGKQK